MHQFRLEVAYIAISPFPCFNIKTREVYCYPYTEAFKRLNVCQAGISLQLCDYKIYEFFSDKCSFKILFSS